MDYRIIVLLSPYIEKSIYESSGKIDFWLEAVLAFLKKMKNIANLIIPNNLYYSCSKNIQIILEPYKNDPQSGLIISDDICVPCENRDKLNEMFNFDFYSDFVRLFIHFMNLRNVPLVIDELANKLVKEECVNCLTNDFCRPEIIIDTATIKIENFEFYKEILSNFYEDYLCYLSKNKLIETYEDVTTLSILTAMLYGVDHNELNEFKNIEYHNSFLNEIKGLRDEDLKSVFSSIFRCTVYSSTEDSSRRHKNSIDWHKQSGHKKIYRCDVLPWGKSGIGSSGKKRLLFKKVEKICFLAYTDDHDFSENLIKNRDVFY